MKLVNLFFLTLFIFTGCSQSKISTQKEKKQAIIFDNLILQQSYEYLQTLPKSYSYTNATYSYIGHSGQTTVTVKDDVIVKREFKEGMFNDLKTIYIENKKDLNKNKKGFPPKKLEALYAQCDKEVLTKDKNENKIYLTFEKRVLKSCIYVPINCADDCSKGIYFSNVTFN